MSEPVVERLATVHYLHGGKRSAANDAGRDEAAADDRDPRSLGSVVADLRERMQAIQERPASASGPRCVPDEDEAPARLASVRAISGEAFSEDAVTDPARIRDLAVRALARRDYSERGLAAKLVSLGVPAMLAEAEAQQLVALGFVNDARMAESLVERLMQRKRLSRSALIQELKAQHLPADVINRAVAVVDRETEADLALAFAESKRAALTRLEPEVAERRLRGQLQRRGFSADVITQAVRAVLPAGSGPRRSFSSRGAAATGQWPSRRPAGGTSGPRFH